jgi:hypothetical protein
MSNYGWICPKCGCVLAPWVSECPHHIIEDWPKPFPNAPWETPITVHYTSKTGYAVGTTDNEIGVK